MSLFWSWKNLSSRTLFSCKYFSLPCDKRLACEQQTYFRSSLLSLRKITSTEDPKFRESCDVVELLFSGKWRIRPELTVSRLSSIFPRLFMRHTIFLRVLRIETHIGSALWNIQHILWLISPFKQHDGGEILINFQGRWTSIYYFFDSQIYNEVLDIFPRLSYRLTFIMLIVGMVDNLEFW